MERPLVVVFNPVAGTQRARRALHSVRAAGSVADVVQTSLGGDFPLRLRDAISAARVSNQGALAVVAVGGDGTLSMTLDALEQPADVPLAIIPCGAGNDFARSLGVRSTQDALEALRSGVERALDYGTVNGRKFVNCVGIGLDADVTSRVARRRLFGPMRGLSYYVAALGALREVRPVGCVVSINGESRRFENVVMVTAGNGRWYGGGFLGAPNAALDDGILDCYVFSNVAGLLPRLALMQRIRNGTHPGDAAVTGLRTARLHACFDRKMPMHVDGEVSSTSEAVIEVRPGGARFLLRVPRAA